MGWAARRNPESRVNNPHKPPKPEKPRTVLDAIVHPRQNPLAALMRHWRPPVKRK